VFQELKVKPLPTVLASFSGGSKGCMYKVIQLLDGRCEGDATMVCHAFPLFPFNSIHTFILITSTEGIGSCEEILLELLFKTCVETNVCQLSYGLGTARS